MATHSSILAWKIPWTEEPVYIYSELYIYISIADYSPRGHRVRHDWAWAQHNFGWELGHCGWLLMRTLNSIIQSPEEYDIFVLAVLPKKKKYSVSWAISRILSLVHWPFAELLADWHIHSWFRDQPGIGEVFTQNLGLSSLALSFWRFPPLFSMSVTSLNTFP